MNPIQRIFNSFRRTPQQPQKNSISNDFLRRGNEKAKNTLLIDKKLNPELEVSGWFFAALNIRTNTFAEFNEDNIITESNIDNPDVIHPYIKLLKDHCNVSEFDFWHDLLMDYDIYGDAFIFLLRRVVYNDDKTFYRGRRKIYHIGLPTSIEALDTKNVRILKDTLGNVVGYREWVDTTHYREFLPEQVIHVRNKNPLNHKEAYSIFDACRDYQYTLSKGSEFAQNALVNNINTPGILSTDEVLNDEEYDNLLSRINGHEPGKIIVSDGTGQLHYSPIGQDIDKASLPSLTDISRETIFAVTGTSKTILGIEESGVTRQTSLAQLKKFTNTTIAPLTRKFISAMNFDYRMFYPDTYNQTKIKIEKKDIYDPEETTEQFNAQKLLFDDVTEIVYSGYTKESAEDFMYGNIPYTALELDESDANDIEEEQESISGDGPDSNPQSSPEDTGETKPEEDIDNTSENSLKVENQQTLHTHDDYDYIDKALRLHTNSLGELDENGKAIKLKIEGARKNLLKEVRKAQLEAIQNSVIKIGNSFSESDITTKSQKESIYNRIYKSLKKYWMFIIPLLGRERLEEDQQSTKLQANVNLLGIKSVNDYIKEQSEKAAESHTNTIYKTITDAANKAEEKVIKKEFAKEYLQSFKPSNWFKTKPTQKSVISKLSNPKFVSDNEELYNSVREKINQGLNRNEIQKAIREEYVNLSRTRANILVNNEMNRSINSTQYLADFNFLKKVGKLNNAYKQLVSSTGNPCPICKALIDKGEIPFTENYLDLGDSITVKDGNKTTVFNCNYENIESGCVHCNCKCFSRLIIKD